MPDAASAGDDARHEACVAGEVLGTGKATNIADLQPNERREDLTDAGDRAQELHLRRWLKCDSNALLDFLNLNFELIERRELDPDHGRRFARQAVECSVDVDAALDPEQIADAGRLKSVPIDSRVNSVLERGPQVAQRHASAEELTLVAQLARRNPALRQDRDYRLPFSFPSSFDSVSFKPSRLSVSCSI